MHNDEEDGRIDDDQVDEEDRKANDGDHVDGKPGNKVVPFSQTFKVQVDV